MSEIAESAEASVSSIVEGPTIAASLRSAAVYAVGGALPRAIGLITLPIYTHVVVPSQYGTFSLLVTISSAVALLFSLGLDVAVVRIFFQLADDARRQERFVNAVWVVLIVVPTTAAATIGCVAWPLIGRARFGGLDLLLALAGAASSVAATTVPLAVLRAEQRLRDFLIVTSTATFATSGISLIFVAGLHWGIRGWLVAAILANLITFVTAVLVVPFRPARAMDWGLVRYALRFGAPLVPHSLAYWALQVADRAVIAGMVSGAALGVYSLGSNLGLPVLVLVQSLNYGFMPAYARAGAGRTSRRDLADTVVLQAAAVAFICASCALLAPPFVELTTPSSYGHAAALVPWIALGYGFLGLYAIPMNGVSLGAGRTNFVAVVSLTAVTVNVGLLYAFVPSGGIRAAAIASAAAYAILLLLVFGYAWRPENPVTYRWKPLAVVFATVGAVYVAARFTSTDAGGVSSLLVRSAWLVLASVVVLLARARTRALALNHLRAIGRPWPTR